MLNVFLISIAALLGLTMAACIVLGWYLYRSIAHHINYSTDHTWSDGLAKGEIWPDFAKVPIEKASIRSFDDCEIAVVAIPGTRDKTIVFSHGVSWTWHGMIKFMPTFLERGWNIVAFDHRNHGQSGGHFKSFGVLEKHDVKAVIDWTYRRFPNTNTLGMFGESMGAAIAAQWQEIDPRATFLVLDSCFSDLEELLSCRMTHVHIPRLLHGFILYCSRFFTKRIGNFSFADVSPRRSLASINTPTMFFHVKSDELIPWKMTVELANSRSDQVHSETFFTEKGAHSRAVMEDPSGYEAALWRFVDAVLRQRS